MTSYLADMDPNLRKKKLIGFPHNEETRPWVWGNPTRLFWVINDPLIIPEMSYHLICRYTEFLKGEIKYYNKKKHLLYKIQITLIYEIKKVQKYKLFLNIY